MGWRIFSLLAMNDTPLVPPQWQALIHNAPISPPPETSETLGRFFSFLLQQNEIHNLTGHRTLEDCFHFHLVDSWKVLNAGEELSLGASIIDIGSGAGIPGLIWKMLRPDLRVTLVDSVLKKVSFIQEAISLLQLQGCQALHKRAEDIAHLPEHREQYHLATARALAELPACLELTAPFVRAQGEIRLPRAEQDHSQAQSRADHFERTLGCTLIDTVAYGIPHRDRASIVLRYRKTCHAAPKYPRKPAQIKKRPL